MKKFYTCVLHIYNIHDSLLMLVNYFIIFTGCSSTHVGSVNTIDRVGLHLYMIY